MKTQSDDCFAWAIMSALFPIHKSSDRCESYPHYRDHLNFTGIEFPVALKNIPKFEKQNNVSVNVFIPENKQILPVHLTKDEKKQHVNLLLLTEN